jgi:hypothetical protein
MTFIGTVVPGFVRMTFFVVVFRHRFVAVFDDHVARLTPALAAAPPGSTLTRSRPPTTEAEVFEGIAIHRGNRHANAAARHLADEELRQQFADRVARHGEADPDVSLALRVGDDRGVHPDDLAADVQERPAGVAGVDGRIGLQHLVRAAVGDAEGALRRADDADRHRVGVAERVADRHDPVTRGHL